MIYNWQGVLPAAIIVSCEKQENWKSKKTEVHSTMYNFVTTTFQVNVS